jgi:uncharacterized SAM-binding protein YcdF (DUF218 family)
VAAIRCLVGGVLGLLGVAQFVVLFVVPPERSAPPGTDAVVVLSGDHGDRLALGLQLVRTGQSGVLVILRPSDGPYAASRPLCEEPQPFEVVCTDPAVVSTAGDVAEIARLADGLGWRDVAVVTSRFHVARSQVILDRCTSVRAVVVGSDPPFSPRQWLAPLAHEMGGLLQALTTLRCA